MHQERVEQSGEPDIEDPPGSDEWEDQGSAEPSGSSEVENKEAVAQVSQIITHVFLIDTKCSFSFSRPLLTASPSQSPFNHSPNSRGNNHNKKTATLEPPLQRQPRR